MTEDILLKKVFVGGSKNIGRLPKQVIMHLDCLIENNTDFLVGDCHGADLALQNYLNSKHYCHVTVYCSGLKCRFNTGNWKEQHILVEKNVHGYEFYRQKDLAMIDECDEAFFIWNGQSRGIKNNIDDLQKHGKKINTYYVNK